MTAALSFWRPSAADGKSLPRQDEATGNPEKNPQRSRVLPKWPGCRPHARTRAMEGFFHRELGRLAALCGAVSMFLIQPPADWWLLAWLAPLPWLWLVARSPAAAAAAPVSWRFLWLAGWLHWLATIHWLRLPHPATAIGWLLLSAYLACYLPLFIWLARRLIGRWGWPLVVAAPVAWMACEQLRGWLLGGFTFGRLGHTQWRWVELLQVADIAGAVGVGGLVMLGAAAGYGLIAGGLPRGADRGPDGRRGIIQQALVATGLLLAAVAYGRWRLATVPEPVGKPLDVLLVQGSIDTELKHDPAAVTDVTRHYDELTRAGLAGGSRPDLIVWPETMWRVGLLEIDPAEQLPESLIETILGPAEDGGSVVLTAEQRQTRCRARLEAERLAPLTAYAKSYGSHWLVGVDKQRITPRAATGSENFNMAVLLDAEGRPIGEYAKMYPVMFGEYVPLADRFPWLYRLTPLPAGLTAGHEPLLATVAGRRLTATICYETALPGAVRSLVRRCRRADGGPDLIANLTNDGWFWGSSELDMHLTAAIFRAVEVRTPIVIAANTGFSASIDSSGRLLAQGPRRAPATLRAAVRPDGRETLWLAWGSLLPGICVAIGVAVTLEGWVRRDSL